MNIQLMVKNNDNEIIHYITDFEKNDRIYLDKITNIYEKAFYNATVKSSVEVFINLEFSIKKNAFEKCLLTDFICVNGQERFSNNECEDFTEHNNLEIQYRAFKDCENLNSVIFPLFKNISIENEAFKNCTNLRTVVLLCRKGAEHIYIAPDAFDENENLVFVCIKGSAVERYAREHNFRIINVKD